MASQSANETPSTNESTLTKEIKEYFANLIRPLATQESFENALTAFKTEVLDKIDDRLRKQDEKIKTLESTLEVRASTMDNLMIKIDDNEQYSRRACLRINNVEYEEKENVMGKVEKCYGDVNLDFEKNAIDGTHRVGKKFKKVDKTFQPIIVKFRSWSDRLTFFKARPRRKNDEEKPPFSVTVNLTERRLKLLILARELCNGHDKIKFVFADINGSLAICSKVGKFYYFNSESELKSQMAKL